jgi:hypothetical protein
VQLGQYFDQTPTPKPKHTPTIRFSTISNAQIPHFKIFFGMQQNSFLKKGHTQTPIFGNF